MKKYYQAYRTVRQSNQSEESLDALKVLIKVLPEEKQRIHFSSIELSIRCANTLEREGIKTPGELLALSNANILKWWSFGQKSIIELQAAIREISNLELRDAEITFIESELWNWIKTYLEENTDKKPFFERAGIVDDVSYLQHRKFLENDVAFDADNFRYDFFFKNINCKNPIEILKICPTWLLEMDVFYFECSTRICNVIAENNIKIIGDFRKYNMGELSRIGNVGRKSIIELAEFIHKAKLKGPPPLEENAPSPKNLKDSFFESFKKIKNRNHKFIIEQRLGIWGAIETLEKIGRELDLTRERVRQIQKKVIGNIIKGEFWDDYLKMRILPITKNPKNPIYLDKLGELDPWFSGFENNETLLKGIITHFSHVKQKFLTHNNRIILCGINNDEWDKLKSELLKSFEYSIDLQYTIEDVEMVIENRLSNFEAKELTSLMFDELSPVLHFSSTDDCNLVLSSIGNTISSQIKVILDGEPEPLHYSEIGKLYEQHYGVKISKRNIHARLNYGEFLLFERGTYGTRRHLELSEGDEKTIIQQTEKFLENNADKQCHSDEILKKITVKGIDKYKLSIVLQGSKLITYLGKMVWVFEDENKEQERLHIKKAVISILRRKGVPMRIAELEKEISQFRSVGAHFAMNLQPNALFSRVDHATWGLLERDFILSENEWVPIKNYFNDYFTHSKKALHISELNQTISKLNLDKKITVGHVVGVLSSDNRFRKWRNGFIGLAYWESPNRTAFAEAIDIVLKQNAHENFTLESIEHSLKEITGYDVEKNRITAHLTKKGYEYNENKNFWYNPS